ncbi:zinc permease [Candidatus Peribacteria bacterium]|nr:zinc permease [Candidatus Peribacteria bacterium]
MSFSQTLFLGAISGFTILLGMPLARLRAVSKEHLSFLNALAIGVLFFLFVDVMEHAIGPVEEAIEQQGHDLGVLLFVLIGGFTIGLMALVYYGRHYLRKDEGMSQTQLALLIAIGIGIHNFSEGLAIGSSAVQGELKLALLLIMGFGLHNITEAFGIAAPLAGEKKVSWGFLLLLGLIGGGPNFLGTLIGYSYSSSVLSVLFLSLGAGAIIYVIGELLAAGRKLQAHAWAGWGLALGFFAGLLTDFMLVYAGA